MVTETQLYRHFSSDGKLLYIGISLSTPGRLAQHKEHSHWFKDIARVEIERFPDRPTALIAESAAISRERPAWNIHHKRPENAPKEDTSEWAETARKDLTHKVVTLNPIYSVEAAGKFLEIGKSAAQRLIDSGVLGHVKFPPFRPGGRPILKVSGWQLIDYLEMMSQRGPT